MKTKYLLAILLTVALLVTANILPNQFLWDDEEQIIANSQIRELKNIPQLFLKSTGTAGGSDPKVGFYRPLMFTVYTLAYYLFNLNPGGYHLIQILFHLGNVTLLFLILKRLFTQAELTYPEWLAFAATCLFAVHPMNLEAVAYLGAMGETLAAFFVLSGLWLIITKVKTFSSPTFLIALVLGLTGLFAKETAATFFILAAIYLYLFKKLKKDQLINSGFILSLPLVFYALVRLFIAQVSLAQPHVVPIAKASLLQRLLTIPWEIITYLTLFLFPIKLQIYRHFVVLEATDPRFWAIALIVIILGLGALLLIKELPKKKRRLALFGLSWLTITLLPALNLLPLNMTLAERWFYLPMIGLLIFLVSLLSPWFFKQSTLTKNVLIGFLGIFLLALVAQTVTRTFAWRNGYALYSRDFKKDPQNHSLANNLAVELFRKGEYETAHKLLLKSVEIEPNWATSRNNLGASFQKRGDLEKALKQYQRSLSLSDYYLAYQNYPGLLLRLDRAQEAREFLETQAIPKYPQNLQLYLLLAQAYGQTGQTDKALQIVDMLLDANPENETLLNLKQQLTDQ